MPDVWHARMCGLGGTSRDTFAGAIPGDDAVSGAAGPRVSSSLRSAAPRAYARSHWELGRGLAHRHADEESEAPLTLSERARLRELEREVRELRMETIS